MVVKEQTIKWFLKDLVICTYMLFLQYISYSNMTHSLLIMNVQAVSVIKFKELVACYLC